MTFHPRIRQNLFLSTVLGSLALSTPVMALDADDFATKFSALSNQNGSKLSFSAVEPDGNTVVLKSATAKAPGQPPFELGDITFNGVEETGGGSYFVDSAVFSDVNIKDGPTSVSISDIEMTGLTIPADGDMSSVDDILFYEGFSTGAISVQTNGAQIFSMSGLDLNVERPGGGTKVNMVMDGSGLKIDPSKINDPKARDTFKQLGYDTLTGDLKLNGTWDVDSGMVDLSNYSITLDDVGRLAMSIQISGYTLEFIKAMQQAQVAAASNPDPQAAQQAIGFAMLGMMQQLSFNSASIRFEDASVTERALAFAGKKQGLSGDDMRGALKGMLPLMLGGLGIPSLQKQISAAASTYLDNPENITISATPSSPVAVPVIMGAGMGDPKSLVDLLNVQITANEPVESCCKN
jgi:hypothetical protein